jgi:hypothetical protein
MKINKLVSIGGLAITIGAFAPAVFAQTGGAPSAGGAGVTANAPATGQPGTQAPASAAPIGSASSDYMSHEGHTPPTVSTPASTREETEARRTEVMVQRDIVAARARGLNVATAQHQKWLGSIALSKGDRATAMKDFNHAETDLRKAGYKMSENGVRLNDNRTNLNANETDQTPNAANMHPNSGANSAY